MMRIRNKALVSSPLSPSRSVWSPSSWPQIPPPPRGQDRGDDRAAAGNPRRPLADLPRGSSALVLDLAVGSGLGHRLQALGLRPGQRVQVLRRAWWSGPIHLRVGMTELMLRRRDAAGIGVQALDGGS